MTRVIGILDNLRSIHNVGSIFRTADGLGVEKLSLCGTTPHPRPDEPWRRDHLALKKTALGAENSVPWEYQADTLTAIETLKESGWTILALETAPEIQTLEKCQFSSVSGEVSNIGLVVGNEVTGLSPEILAGCDHIVQIPMRGTKESLNVAVAFGIAAHWLLTHPHC